MLLLYFFKCNLKLIPLQLLMPITFQGCLLFKSYVHGVEFVINFLILVNFYLLLQIHSQNCISSKQLVNRKLMSFFKSCRVFCHRGYILTQIITLTALYKHCNKVPHCSFCVCIQPSSGFSQPAAYISAPSVYSSSSHWQNTGEQWRQWCNLATSFYRALTSLWYWLRAIPHWPTANNEKHPRQSNTLRKLQPLTQGQVMIVRYLKPAGFTLRLTQMLKQHVKANFKLTSADRGTTTHYYVSSVIFESNTFFFLNSI